MPLGGVAIFVSVDEKSRYNRKQNLSVNLNYHGITFCCPAGRAMPPNGPAIWGGCVTRRSIRAGSWYPVPSTREGHKTVTVQGGFGACFCRHGKNFIVFWSGSGTSLIGAANLSPVTNLVGCTGAVSRYKVDRSQKTVKVYRI